MTMRFVVGALIAVLALSPALAQTGAPKERPGRAAVAAEREKRKECSAKWKDEKAKGARGAKAWHTFMANCL